MRTLSSLGITYRVRDRYIKEAMIRITVTGIPRNGIPFFFSLAKRLNISYNKKSWIAGYI